MGSHAKLRVVACAGRARREAQCRGRFRERRLKPDNGTGEGRGNAFRTRAKLTVQAAWPVYMHAARPAAWGAIQKRRLPC
jgi:hypothetical protein